MTGTWTLIAIYLFYRGIQGLRTGQIKQMNSFKKPPFWICYRKKKPVLFWADVGLSFAIGAAFAAIVIADTFFIKGKS